MNSGFVFVQAEKSFGEAFAQFPFHSIGLGVQQAAPVGIIGGFNLIWGGAGTKSCDGAANARGDDQQRGSKGQRAEDEDQKLIHALMILHGGQLARNGSTFEESALAQTKVCATSENRRIRSDSRAEVVVGTVRVKTFKLSGVPYCEAHKKAVEMNAGLGNQLYLD